jgi:hypothetical protein
MIGEIMPTDESVGFRLRCPGLEIAQAWRLPVIGVDIDPVEKAVFKIFRSALGAMCTLKASHETDYSRAALDAHDRRVGCAKSGTRRSWERE